MSEHYCPSCGRTFPSQAAAQRHAEFCDGAPEDYLLAGRAKIGSQELHREVLRERACNEARERLADDVHFAAQLARDALGTNDPVPIAWLTAAIIQRRLLPG